MAPSAPTQRPGWRSTIRTTARRPVSLTPPDSACTDEGALVAKAGRFDDRLGREVEAGVAPELGVGGVEERCTEAEGDRSRHHGEVEVEEVRDTRHRPAGQRARPLNDRRRRLGGRAPGDGRDRRPGGFCLEAPEATARAGSPVRNDDDVADVPGVAEPAVEETAVEDDAPADTGRDDHRYVVVAADGSAAPPLGQGEGLGVVLHERGEARVLSKAPTEGEGLPAGDVEGRDLVATGGHRATAADATGHEAIRSYLGARRGGQAGQDGEELLGARPRGGRRLAATREGAVGPDHCGAHLGAADVDGQHRLVHGADRISDRGARNGCGTSPWSRAPSSRSPRSSPTARPRGGSG